MKFVLSGAIWDSGSILAESENGIFETDDSIVIEKLKAKGYKEFVEKSTIQAESKSEPKKEKGKKK